MYVIIIIVVLLQKVQNYMNSTITTKSSQQNVPGNNLCQECSMRK